MNHTNQFKRCQYHNPTLVSVPWNDLTSAFTKPFIFVKSDDDTLPEPSNRNATSAWLRHTVKKRKWSLSLQFLVGVLSLCVSLCLCVMVANPDKSPLFTSSDIATYVRL